MTTMGASLPNDLSREFGVHFCEMCQAEYSPLMHSLYVVINGYMYRWSTFTVLGGAALFFIGKPGIPGEKANEDVKEVLSFSEKDMPIISPDNIMHRVSTMLTFM